jgi:hypothetical protein
MSEPWFDANQWAWVPGTALGCLAGLWGALAGVLAPRGKAKGLLWGTYWLLLGAGAVLLVVGLVAVVAGQPYGVWFGLLIAGVLVCVVFAPMAVVLRHTYRAAEERKMRAQEFGE